MEEPEFIHIKELRIKNEGSFLNIGKQIKDHVEKDLEAKYVLYQREYYILIMSSPDDKLIQSCIFWIAEHVRIPGIKLRIFHRKEYAFDPPYNHFNKEGIMMTLAEIIGTVVAKNIYIYDTFFFLTTKDIPAKHTDNVWIILQEKIRQQTAHHKFLLTQADKQKIPSNI